MSEMAERVAKATQEVARSMGSSFDDYVAAEVARAAITAMREPTAEMKAAIADQKESGGWYDAAPVIEIGYEAMIDAALGKVDA